MASQTTTTILTVAASLGTDPDAADVQIASHCLRCICRQEASQTNIVILTVLQNHSQHPSLLRAPAEQKPRHAAADVPASWSVSGSAWAGGLGLSHEKFPAGKAGINEALLLFPPIPMMNRTALEDVQVLTWLNCHLQVDWHVCYAPTPGLSALKL